MLFTQLLLTYKMQKFFCNMGQLTVFIPDQDIGGSACRFNDLFDTYIREVCNVSRRRLDRL